MELQIGIFFINQIEIMILLSEEYLRLTLGLFNFDLYFRDYFI